MSELYDHEKRYQAMHDAGPVLYEALGRFIAIVADRPALQNDDEVWGAFSQAVCAMSKARGEQP